MYSINIRQIIGAYNYEKTRGNESFFKNTKMFSKALELFQIMLYTNSEIKIAFKSKRIVGENTLYEGG